MREIGLWQFLGNFLKLLMLYPVGPPFWAALHFGPQDEGYKPEMMECEIGEILIMHPLTNWKESIEL